MQITMNINGVVIEVKGDAADIVAVVQALNGVASNVQEILAAALKPEKK